MVNRKCIILIIAIILIILYIIIGICTYDKTHTINPIRALIGYVKVKVFNANYSVVQNFPHKTIYANPNKEYYLDEYMKERGFTEIPEATMGGREVYTNGKVEEPVMQSGGFSEKSVIIWEWE